MECSACGGGKGGYLQKTKGSEVLVRMKLFVMLAALSLLFSAAYGLHCYACTDHNCNKLKNVTCPAVSNRCYTIITRWKVTSKGCGSSDLCLGSCCQGDLCNGAKHAGPSAIILLVSTAIITLIL